MNPDALDDQLHRSAPTSVAPTPALHADLAAMMRDAEAEVTRTAPPTRRRVSRIAIGAGLALAMLGGAGAAVAAGGFAWLPWAQDPDVAYAYTLPSGRACEARVLTDNASLGADGASPESVAQLRSWLAATDVLAIADVDGVLATLRSEPDPELMVVLTPEGPLDVVPRTAEGPTPDDEYAQAVDRAVNEAIAAHAATIDTGWWAFAIQMQCER
ncbi:hypothetical protein ASD65_03370 [Microbacterium sp. Root61]|uniref:hypothetical protein n=1 Tax=Microbacterium sp. Root61 TaxID=1736570 RepID=UPI0006FFDFB5|nr:hypothetical protein [Microbacterium sp. Root61]KRA23568.1 hypothetical protein ASD65_03370 [Microbacterium sp. Root61]